MSTLRSSPEFKQEAVRQIVDRRLAVREGPLHKGVVPDIAGAFLVVSGALPLQAHRPPCCTDAALACTSARLRRRSVELWVAPGIRHRARHDLRARAACDRGRLDQQGRFPWLRRAMRKKARQPDERMPSEELRRRRQPPQVGESCGPVGVEHPHRGGSTHWSVQEANTATPEKLLDFGRRPTL